MTTAKILKCAAELSALVVGDICLDRWCVYDPAEAEPSRETGIPRVGVISTTVTPGAGGTVANNLVALGLDRVCVLGVAGEDGFGYELRCGLEARRISTELIVLPSVQTFTYTKLINSVTGEEDLPRLDFICNPALDPAHESEILKRLRRRAGEFDIIVIADQAETAGGGVITAAVRDALAELAAEYADQVFLADSRERITEFRNVVIKPNRQEAEAACTRLFGQVDYERLRRHVAAPLLYVTHGDEGVALVTPQGEERIAARSVAKPVDICGAGDSFAAGASVALAVTRSPRAAAQFGNLVASVTIMKKGTGTASPEELLAHEHPGD